MKERLQEVSGIHGEMRGAGEVRRNRGGEVIKRRTSFRKIPRRNKPLNARTGGADEGDGGKRRTRRDLAGWQTSAGPTTEGWSVQTLGTTTTLWFLTTTQIHSNKRWKIRRQ